MGVGRSIGRVMPETEVATSVMSPWRTPPRAMQGTLYTPGRGFGRRGESWWMIDNNDDRTRHVPISEPFCGCWISLFTRMLREKNSITIRDILQMPRYVRGPFAEQPSEVSRQKWFIICAETETALRNIIEQSFMIERCKTTTTWDLATVNQLNAKSIDSSTHSRTKTRPRRRSPTMTTTSTTSAGYGLTTVQHFTDGLLPH
jgi:hypothetical protein